MNKPLLLSRNEINDARWNDLVKKSEQQVIYGYSWYLDTVCELWKALVWPSAEEYKILMPLPIKRKWLIEVIQQPLFCQYLGIFSIQDLSRNDLEGFLSCLRENFSYISSYSFNPHNTPILKIYFSYAPIFQIKESTTFWLSLSSSFDNIKNGYSPDRKLNTNRSLKANWNVIRSDNLEPLLKLFKENHAKNIHGSVHKNAYSILRKLFEQVTDYQFADLIYTRKGNTIHAGILLMRSENKIIYLFNAADEVGRDGNARTYLLNRFFESNSGKPLLFDFESPEVKNIALFYKSFGAEPKIYFTIKRNNLPFPLHQIQNWRLKRLINTRQVPSEGF